MFLKLVKNTVCSSENLDLVLKSLFTSPDCDGKLVHLLQKLTFPVQKCLNEAIRLSYPASLISLLRNCLQIEQKRREKIKYGSISLLCHLTREATLSGQGNTSAHTCF